MTKEGFTFRVRSIIKHVRSIPLTALTDLRIQMRHVFTLFTTLYQLLKIFIQKETFYCNCPLEVNTLNFRKLKYIWQYLGNTVEKMYIFNVIIYVCVCIYFGLTYFSV
jgi:hypothetical protein